MRKFNKAVLIILSIVLMATMLVGCGNEEVDDVKDEKTSQEANKSQDKQILTIGTSTPGGNFYLIGSGWANLVTKHSDHVEIASEVTGGSTANLTMIDNGELDIGVTLGSTIVEALEGEEEWTQGNKLEKSRILLPLYPSHMTIYSLESKGIKSIHDLNGKRVGTGNLGAGVDSIAKKVFKILDIKPGSFHNDSHSNTVIAAGDDVIDVGVSFQNPPYPALMDLEATKKVSYVGFTQEEIDKILEEMPYFTQGIIPKGSYKGAKEDIDTITDWNWLVCSEDLPEDLVYEIVKTSFENQAEMLNIHKCTEDMDPNNYIYASTKLHPGVIKYLDEVGIEVPDELK